MFRKTRGVCALWLLSMLGAGLLGSQAAALETSAEEAARGVLERLLPQRAGCFVLESVPKQDGQDVFEIEAVDGKIVIRGSGGVAMCSGLNWYLKHHCHCHVSWCGDQLDLPDPLPSVKEKVRRISPFKYRYCFNFCAFSYTLAWWDWPQWERMIDWMALHGINMPLSVTGQEAIWQKVYRDLGLSDEQILEFIAGPAYLPFGWMGCLDGWGGPLPQSWIDAHLQLQKKIFARQRDLGMTPVLQGFTGHVPLALKEKLPQAKLCKLPTWYEFQTYFLDPIDPLFEQIGKAFIEEQTRQFGTAHLYASDTFIEMKPPTNDPEFLAAAGKAVYGAMKAGDPKAIWVMQGWIFKHSPGFWKKPQATALFGAVPDDRMILLDLKCEEYPVWHRTEAFYGKPWIWCIVQSFGGNVRMATGMPQISHNLDIAMNSPNRGRLLGIGMAMEGLGYNPIAYDWVTDMAWRTEVPALEPWVLDFARRRYGHLPENARQAWKVLLNTVYASPGRETSVICTRPTLASSSSWIHPKASAELVPAWGKLLECADKLEDVDTYRYDVVHVGRQVLSNLASAFQAEAVAAYKAKDRNALAEATQQYLQLISDLDELLATRSEFLLGKWLADANHWGANEEERHLYQWNARYQITLWGPHGPNDYAHKQWSGLLQGYYLPRWKMFLEDLDSSLAHGKPIDAKEFAVKLTAWEENWTHQTEPYAAGPSGDSVAVARKLWAKYGPRKSRYGIIR